VIGRYRIIGLVGGVGKMAHRHVTGAGPKALPKGPPVRIQSVLVLVGQGL